jgi:hypothetical protein
MNDDVLAHIGQFADADARRAMGFLPNRLSPSSDSRYAYLHAMFARRRVDNWIAWGHAVQIMSGRFHILIQVYGRNEKDKDTQTKSTYGMHGGDLWDVVQSEETIKSHHFKLDEHNGHRLHECSNWRNGRWVSWCRIKTSVCFSSGN